MDQLQLRGSGHAMRTTFRRFARDESGATAIEYVLLASLIAVAIIVGSQTLGTTLNARFGGLATTVSAASAGH